MVILYEIILSSTDFSLKFLALYFEGKLGLKFFLSYRRKSVACDNYVFEEKEDESLMNNA